jgi:hypothetical protein
MSRSRISRLLFALSALLATAGLARAAPAAARPPRSSKSGPGVEGHVRDAGGAPIAGARVVAWRVDHETRATPVEVAATRTDGKGVFLLRRLGTGTFEIEVDATGYRPGRIGVHLPDGSASLFPVEVSLAPAPSTTSPTAAAEPEKPTPRSALETPAPEPGLATTAAPATSPPPTPKSGRAARTPGGDVGATMLEARAAIEGGRLRRARALLAGVDAVRPEDADVFYAVGEGLLRAGETAAAVAFLEKALARDPSHVEAHYRCALGLLALGRNAEARAEFEKVLELRADGPLAEGARRALGELDAAPKGE